MRRALTLVATSLLVTTSLPAAADTGVFLGGGARWSDVDDEATFLLRVSVDVAPLLTLGFDLHGLTGDSTLALDFGGGAVGLFLTPPMPGGVGLELGLEAGLVPLTAARHGDDGLYAYVAGEIAATLDLGAGAALRLAYDHTLTSGEARQAITSQLVLALGVKL